jgi:hypothetical protein
MQEAVHGDGAVSQADTGTPTATPTTRATVNWTTLLRVHAMGPLGSLSINPSNYKHFILIAGGIGITPIAPLHFLLTQRSLPKHSTVLNRLASCCGRKAASTSSSPIQCHSLSTIWTTRDRSLIEAFAPLLSPEGQEGAKNEAGVTASPLTVEPVAATPRLSVTPTNALVVGQRLAAARQWVSSFSIASNVVLQTASSRTMMQLKVFLTSGRKAATAPQAVLPISPAPTVIPPLLPSPLPSPLLTSPGRKKVIRPAPLPPVAETGGMGGSIRNLSLALGLLSEPVTGTSGETVDVGSEALDEKTVEILTTANAAAVVPVPLVSKTRPNIPMLLDQLARSVHASHGLHAQRNAPQSTTPTPSRWPRCFRNSPIKALDDSAAGPDNRMVIAVMVCGPHEMVMETLDACKAINNSRLGERVVLHVHHETYLF